MVEFPLGPVLDRICFYSSKPSGRLEIQLESFHQLYNTRSQSLQFLGFVWRCRRQLQPLKNPIRGDESGSSWRGEFVPCFFVGKYHQDKPLVYLRVLKNAVKNHMLLAMLCDRLSQGYNGMSFSKKLLEVFCGFWDPTCNPQKMKERNCSLDNECDRGQRSLTMWMYPQSYIHLNHLRLHGVSQALWEYSVVILFGLHFVPANSMQSCHCSIYFRSKPIWCWVQIKSNPKLNSG